MTDDDTITPDLIDTLRRIANKANTTRKSLAAGTAISGTHALQAIEYEASDALVRAGATDGER